MPIHIPAVWQLNVPPRVHIFLWLLYNNKLLTRDNLQKKKRDAEDKSCLFCCEEESINHLFFDCCVSKLIWGWISEVTEIQVGVDFESIGRWWISNNKNAVLNCTCAALPVGLHRCPSDTTPTQTDGLACLLVAQPVASYVL